MELIGSSTINETWKLCTFGGLVGCLLLLLFLNQTPNQVSDLSTARISMVEFTPLAQPVQSPTSNLTMALEPMPSNFTIDEHIQKKANFTINPIESKAKLSTNPIEKKANNLTVNPIEKPKNDTKKKCNIFDGKWVYKPEEVPTYNSSVCPFLEDKMSCQQNGRPDSDYEKWRWEGKDCDIPLFNGTDMLERLRNKRMIIAGDSLNRNQWESLACLLYSSISPSRAEVDAHGPAYKVLKAKDYNFTLEFYWSPFLVDFNEKHESGKKVVVLDKLSPNSKQWLGADIMVFNSGHWWTHLGKYKVWDFLQYKGELIEDMPLETQYEHGLKTWANWIETNVDPKKTKVFFRSISAEHKRNQWCYNATQPIMDESYESLFPKSLIDIVEGVLTSLNKSQVKYLNITKLSQYRMDAHPSVYRSWRWKIYTTKYKSLIPSYADCSHWCLPGLPDTWNRLLYASLFFDPLGDMSSS